MASYNPLAYISDTSGALEINGNAFSFKDCDIKMLGSSVYYLQSINWDESEDASFDVGVGQVGKFLGVGNRSVAGSMEIGLSEFMKLADAAGLVSLMGSPLDIPPFNIAITYYSRLANVRSTNLFNVKFTKIGQSTKQGDTHIYTTLDFIATHVQNVA